MLVRVTPPVRSFADLSFGGVQLYAIFGLPELFLDVSNKGTFLAGWPVASLCLRMTNKFHVIVDVSIAGVRLSAKYALLVDDSSK
jgi:hypothetical protein